MPGKKMTPAPIDRPISRAYLRQFGGWSTAYPPGVSEPTTLRLMENMQVNRDGSVRIRPGLRYLSLLDPVINEGDPRVPIDKPVVGSHEPFFLNDGSKAYLFAVRETDGTVGFRVLANTGTGLLVHALDDLGVDFEVGAGLAFTESTTYVKYLQIDNKIFALSNAGEPMRLFAVGESKSAKRLSSIVRPEWSVADKLSVVQPDAAWIASGVPTASRVNLFTNPSFETNVAGWTAGALTAVSRSSTVGGEIGSYAMRVESLPERTNLMPRPLRGPVAALTGWTIGSGGGTFVVSGGYASRGAVGGGTRAYCNGPTMTGIVAGSNYFASYDVANVAVNANLGVLFRWFNSVGTILLDTWIDLSETAGRKVTPVLTAPAGATQLAIFPSVQSTNASTASFDFRNVLVAKAGEATTYFDGSSGADYFWTGTADASSSVYHPAQTVTVTSDMVSVTAALNYAASIYAIAGSSLRTVTPAVEWFDASAVPTGTSTGVGAADAGTWTRYSKIAAAPAMTTQARMKMSVAGVARGEYHYLDAGLFEQSSSVGVYFDGDTPSSSTDFHSWSGAAHGSTSEEGTLASPATVPPAETKTANTLIGTGTNDFNFGFFYTFYNEVGESAASQITVVKAQRAWSQWKWETANASGEPSGTETPDPSLCADQLVAIVPTAAFDAALAQGAVGWRLYMLTWSDQDPAPVSAFLVGDRRLAAAALYGSNGWLAATPQQAASTAETALLPSLATRANYSDPSKGGQGIVAADRMVVVNDPTAAAVIRWTSNLQGHYTDFTASRGGGFKTLTSGNLFVPACVKLWQNPQSADTLTILCMGVDGRSTGYYMTPAQIAQQSEAVNVMGFEETTATPGTVSPYGVEVANNALYHPLDDQLMKSTASNYNINHTSLTDLVRDQWQGLVEKEHIVSSFHDNRLYYLVHNPSGAALETDCWGNEVWVLDIQAKTPTWSRWLVQGQSLRMIEQGGKTVMSLVRPDGIYYFDPDHSSDDYVDAGVVLSRSIPWLLETNTQGANRAHDAWCHLHQVNIQVGFFQGQMRYGLRGLDRNGKLVDKSKIVRDTNDPGTEAYDLEDFMLIMRDLREWFFYAESVETGGEVEASAGQLSLVQYRYTPISVNVGYAYGSVETFEYGMASNAEADRTTVNGVPMPYIDTARP